MDTAPEKAPIAAPAKVNLVGARRRATRNITVAMGNANRGTRLMHSGTPAWSARPASEPSFQIAAIAAAIETATHPTIGSFRRPRTVLGWARLSTSGASAMAAIRPKVDFNAMAKPVTLAAKFYGAGQNTRSNKLNIGFSATTRIKRSDFGIMYGPTVGDDIDLQISAAFEKVA